MTGSLIHFRHSQAYADKFGNIDFSKKEQTKPKNNMTVIYSDQILPEDLTSSIFLAGPTPRDKITKSWRPEAIQILTDSGFTGKVFIPEHKDPNVGYDYLTQVEWEQKALENSTAIVFWVPRDLKTMPAMTTNVEFGIYHKQPNVFYGRPNSAPKCGYLDFCYKKERGKDAYETMESTLMAAASFVNEDGKNTIKDQLTDEMVAHCHRRTNDHIDSVKEYASKLYDEYPILKTQLVNHDQTKFVVPEYVPYIFTTWNYKCKDDGVSFEVPDQIKNRMTEATFHHIKNNKHHPEFHDKECVNSSCLNTEDRDKPPEEMVDGTLMDEISIIEMCADWCAVSHERKTNPFDWAKMNINVRWKFTDDQESLIYDTLKKLWT